MINVYNYTNYRELLRDQAFQKKKTEDGWTLQRIAERAGMQAPYLTNVFKERAHLSGDQFYALAQLFDWSEEETAFGTLLLEWERSGLKRRRDAFKQRIDETRKAKMKSEAHLKKEVLGANVEENTKFFLNPFYSVIHSFLGLPRFAKAPKRICRALHIDPAQLQTWLKELTKLGFVAAQSDGSYAKLKKNFHLPKESPLCDPHQTLLTNLTNQHLAALPNDEKYGFAVTLSADPVTRDKIQAEFLKFLKAVEPLVKEAPAEELYGMRFDLFRWSFERS